MKTQKQQPVARRRKAKHFTLSPVTMKLLSKLKKDFDGNESRVVDAAVQALAKEKAA